MYDPMPTTDIALLLRHGMLYKKLVASVTKMLDHYNSTRYSYIDTPYVYSLYVHKTGNSCKYSQYTIMVSGHNIQFGNNGGIKWDLLYLHYFLVFWFYYALY